MGFYCSKSSHLDSSSTFPDLLVTPKKGKLPKMVGLMMILLSVQVSIECFSLTAKSPFHLKLTCCLFPLNPIWSSCFLWFFFFSYFIPPLLICQLLGLHALVINFLWITSFFTIPNSRIFCNGFQIKCFYSV